MSPVDRDQRRVTLPSWCASVEVVRCVMGAAGGTEELEPVDTGTEELVPPRAGGWVEVEHKSESFRLLTGVLRNLDGEPQTWTGTLGSPPGTSHHDQTAGCQTGRTGPQAGQTQPPGAGHSCQEKTLT